MISFLGSEAFRCDAKPAADKLRIGSGGPSRIRASRRCQAQVGVWEFVRGSTLPLKIRAKQDCRWDLVSLGEVMVRFDPGDRRSCDRAQLRGLRRRRRIQRRAWAEALLRARYVRSSRRSRMIRWASLLQDLLYQGGVDQTYVRWMPHDGVGRVGAQRIEFYGARIRRTRGGGLLRSRTHRGFAI